MKKTLGILLLLTSSTSAIASELKDCEQKIKKMLDQVHTSFVIVSKTNRIDLYHMSKDRLCGVELTDKFLTVAKFKDATPADEPMLTTKKFETIILNGEDPTFTDGRVKAIVTCEMDENSVIYTTKVPVLTDGSKSPYAVEKLTMKQDQNGIQVSLRSSLTPIQSVFRSITDCVIQ